MARLTPGPNPPTKAQAEEFDMLSKLLDALSIETKEFSKKKPDEALNKLKIKMANRVLSKVKELLKNEATSEFLDTLDEDSIPTNSDAVLIITQFQAAMKQFHSSYHGWDGNEHRWHTKD
mgnify:CR=1 FL=1|tara:strand:- start:4394 stop:4753 length:360 start_codon:yes stop_codon:yes gene_type:complete